MYGRANVMKMSCIYGPSPGLTTLCLGLLPRFLVLEPQLGLQPVGPSPVDILKREGEQL